MSDPTPFDWLDPEKRVSGRRTGKVRTYTPAPDMQVKGASRLREVLARLGYQDMRRGQDNAIMSLLGCTDTYCVLPTSLGKTAIYVVPTLCHNWRTLIFSPLVALMKDQVENLHRLKLAAAQLSSGQHHMENRRALHDWETGNLSFLLAAPERMEIGDFMDVMLRTKPDMVALDEAHCLSQWGDSFRPAYTKIGEFLEKVNPRVVVTLTATATEDVEDDIRTILGLPMARKVVYYPKRENLVMTTIRRDMSPVKYMDGMDQEVLKQVNAIKGPTVVYCATRATCEYLAEELGKDITGDALYYHAGLTPDQRTINQDHFMTNTVRVMFATNAFGLGVNKPDIRGIIHRDVCGSIAALVQEQGRAGRDGEHSDCIMLYDPDTVGLEEWKINTTYPPKSHVERVFHQLSRMADSNKRVQITLKKLAEVVGLKEKVIGSCIGILQAGGAVGRVQEGENCARIKIINDDVPDPISKVIIGTLNTIGNCRPDGYIEFPLRNLSDACCLKVKDLTGRLERLQSDGCISYCPPYRGKTTEIVGDLSGVDFPRLEQRRRDAMDKLKEVKDFIDVPDEEKHDFLLEYFGMKE